MNYSDQELEEKYTVAQSNRKQKRKKKQPNQKTTELLSQFKVLFPQFDDNEITKIIYREGHNFEQIYEALLKISKEDETLVDKYFHELQGNQTVANHWAEDIITVKEEPPPDLFKESTMKSTCRYIFDDPKDVDLIFDYCQENLSELQNRCLDQDFEMWERFENESVPGYFIQQTQGFMEEIIRKRSSQKTQAFNMTREDFPQLIEVADSNPYLNPRPERSIITPSKDQTSIRGYNRDSRVLRQSSLQIVAQIQSMFPSIPLNEIQYAVQQFGELEIVEQFFQRYYDYIYFENTNLRKQMDIAKIEKNTANKQKKKYRTVADPQITGFYSQLGQIDQKEVRPTRKIDDAQTLRSKLSQNRQNIQEIYRQGISMIRCVGKFSHLVNAANYEMHRQKQQDNLEVLYDEAKDLFVDLMHAEGSYDVIDCHGFYGCEIEPLLDEALGAIKELSNVRRVEVIVGKGLHSRNKVLKIGPIAERYLRSHSYKILSNSDGKIVVKL